MNSDKGVSFIHNPPLLDYTTLNDTFQIKWLIEFIKNRESPWNAFANFIFNTPGGIDFLLKCNFSVDKIPVKLDSFHRQALLAWKMVYKLNFSPHD